MGRQPILEGAGTRRQQPGGGKATTAGVNGFLGEAGWLGALGNSEKLLAGTCCPRGAGEISGGG